MNGKKVSDYDRDLYDAKAERVLLQYPVIENVTKAAEKSKLSAF